MDQLLEVKIGCLAGLLVVTLICGLIPAQVRWFQSNMARGKHRRILSAIGCFAAGVFLGACIMHMVADALGDIQEELKKRRQQGASMHKQNRTSEGDDDSEGGGVAVYSKTKKPVKTNLLPIEKSHGGP